MPTDTKPSDRPAPAEVEPETTPDPWRDPSHPGNGSEHLTGEPRIDCYRPAGTAWSHLWCQPCNAERIDRISARLERLAKDTNHAD